MGVDNIPETLKGSITTSVRDSQAAEDSDVLIKHHGAKQQHLTASGLTKASPFSMKSPICLSQTNNLRVSLCCIETFFALS